MSETTAHVEGLAKLTINAAIDTAQPLVLGPQFGGCGATPAEISVAFTAAAALAEPLPTARRMVPVRDTRQIGAAAMRRHGRLGEVRVDPATGRTTLDGDALAVSPADQVPLTRLYFL